MTAVRPTAPSPAFAGAVSFERVLADQPPVLHVDVALDEVRAGRRLVVLNDDPTGTQSIADIPVLTSWSVADVQWALRQPMTAFFILTNTRRLSAADVVDRNREIVAALHKAAELEGVSYVIASRSDSTLRGYYPGGRARAWPAHVVRSAERSKQRLDVLEGRLRGADENCEAACGRLGHASPHRSINQGDVLRQSRSQRADRVRADGGHVDEPLPWAEPAHDAVGGEEYSLERLWSRQHGEHGIRSGHGVSR
jgi:Sugar-binding N-terminal domain